MKASGSLSQRRHQLVTACKEARISVSTAWLQSGAVQSIFMQYEQMEDQNANVITRL
jgi:hypothetical protein